MTRSFSPNAFYYQDSRRVTLEKGIYRYEHSVEIQKSASKESCNMYYLLYLSGRVISNIVSSGTNSQPQIISLSPNFRSPYEFFGDFGFLQRPAPDDTRNRRLF